jgi:hypothetical protein
MSHIITYNSDLESYRGKAKGLVGSHKNLKLDEDGNVALTVGNITKYNVVDGVTHSIALIEFPDDDLSQKFLKSLGLDILAVGDIRDESSANPYKTIFRSSIKKGKYDLAYPLDGTRKPFGVFDL